MSGQYTFNEETQVLIIASEYKHVTILSNSCARLGIDIIDQRIEITHTSKTIF